MHEEKEDEKKDEKKDEKSGGRWNRHGRAKTKKMNGGTGCQERRMTVRRKNS